MIFKGHQHRQMQKEFYPDLSRISIRFRLQAALLVILEQQ